MKSFSELTSASQVNNGDLLAISQTSGSGYASRYAVFPQAVWIFESIGITVDNS